MTTEKGAVLSLEEMLPGKRKFDKKNPCFQELSTKPEEGEEQEPKQGVHTVQGLLQPIHTQPQQVGACEIQVWVRVWSKVFHRHLSFNKYFSDLEIQVELMRWGRL